MRAARPLGTRQTSAPREICQRRRAPRRLGELLPAAPLLISRRPGPLPPRCSLTAPATAPAAARRQRGSPRSHRLPQRPRSARRPRARGGARPPSARWLEGAAPPHVQQGSAGWPPVRHASLRPPSVRWVEEAAPPRAPKGRAGRLPVPQASLRPPAPPVRTGTPPAVRAGPPRGGPPHPASGRASPKRPHGPWKVSEPRRSNMPGRTRSPPSRCGSAPASGPKRCRRPTRGRCSPDGRHEPSR
mmetsp:Transcript_27724/g.87612  ORF Transcript_27724/g.87612 Transcript_27724/m.87612 type:complete len:244 (-) Transcript_27724:674-1405(-)